MRWLLNLILSLLFLTLLWSYQASLMSLKQFWVFEDSFSIVRSITLLWLNQEHFLAVILTLFTIVFPMVKMVILFFYNNASLAWRKQSQQWVIWVETFGKWSMLDVFVVALFFVVLKLGELMDAQLHEGLYGYAAVVIGMQAVSVYLVRTGVAVKKSP